MRRRASGWACSQDDARRGAAPSVPVRAAIGAWDPASFSEARRLGDSAPGRGVGAHRRSEPRRDRPAAPPECEVFRLDFGRIGAYGLLVHRPVGGGEVRLRALFLLTSCAFCLGAAVAAADTSNVPYSLPVTLSPPDRTSPPIASDAPYTSTVVSLINQLLPDNPPTLAEIQNAVQLLRPGSELVVPQHGDGDRAERHEAADRAAVLERRAGDQRERPAGESHVRAAGDPRACVLLRSPLRQCLGTGGRHGGPGADGHRPVRPAGRSRPDPELGARAPVDRRGPVPGRRDVGRADQRCPGRRPDVADEASGGLQRPVSATA